MLLYVKFWLKSGKKIKLFDQNDKNNQLQQYDIVVVTCSKVLNQITSAGPNLFLG